MLLIQKIWSKYLGVCYKPGIKIRKYKINKKSINQGFNMQLNYLEKQELLLFIIITQCQACPLANDSVSIIIRIN